MNNYKDIIDLSPVRKAHRLSVADRAAQFAPFAALTGFGALIDETGRLTDSRPIPDEETLAFLNEQLRLINENIRQRPEVVITYFVPDNRKSGGSINFFRGRVRRTDEVGRELIFSDKTRIGFDDIIMIQTVDNGAAV